MMEGFSPNAQLSASSSTSSPGSSDGMHGATTFPGSSASIDGRASQAPPSVPAACTYCRGKHLKCDGLNPCGRCVLANEPCQYIPSRRGYKGPRRNAAQNPNKRHASDMDSPPISNGPSGTDSCPMFAAHQPVSLPTSTMPVATMGFNPAIVLPDGLTSPSYASTPAMTNLQLFRFSGVDNSNSLALAPSSGLSMQQHNQPLVSLADRCLDTFYFYFFGAHPFVLPKEQLQRLIKEGSTNLEVLLAAIRYVGSLYLDAGPARATYLDQAIRLCYSPNTPKDGFLVQALLLIILGLDGSCQQEKARQLLSDCERIAIEINLNTRQFATMHGRGNVVWQESWRRTWWDLYCCDGMIAGVHKVTTFPLFDITADVALPCEEHQYLSGQIPSPATIEDFDDQLFSADDQEFSSFAYRVAAIRILGRFMRTPMTQFPEDENIARMDAMLTNWRMHLPVSKKDSINKDCQLDEMMFQANFINLACTIMLHQPLSQLDSSPVQSVNSCAPHRHVPSGEAFNLHTRHTIWAANEISKMVTHAVPLISHTFFFTCVVTMSSIVHLSKWAMYFIPESDEEDLRQQVRLNIGALKTLSTVWKAANMACSQVKNVAQEIYREKKAQQISPAFWTVNGFTQEQMISSINADEGIMSDFTTMLNQVTSAP